jgi:hypothetical protein
MVLAADGSFWISDEYGPHIVHFDATGKTIERINPFGTGTGSRKIPLVFAKRRANRGMEGLTITPDGKTLVGLMQSPMYNPSKAAIGNSVVLRILTFDIATGATKQYAYLMENPTLTGCSEITAVNATTFLTIERDGLYGGAPTSLYPKHSLYIIFNIARQGIVYNVHINRIARISEGYTIGYFNAVSCKIVFVLFFNSM